MLNSRQKILNYLSEQHNATVDELSKVFKVSPANIRHHLSILVEQGTVKIVGIKLSQLKGRPAQIYTCIQKNEFFSLYHLADALLSTLLREAAPDKRAQLLHSISTQLMSNFNIYDYNPTRRLYISIRALNNMNYQAHWEAHFENPRIMLGNCPYRIILDQHPELCQLDEFLLEELLGKPVRQIEKLGINTKDLPQCIFIINN